MKTLTFLMFLFCASLTWGQSGLVAAALSAEPQITRFPEHPQHAYQAGMATEQRLFERSQVFAEHGRRPLWEVMPPSQSVPLGDIARMLREDHAAAPKAQRSLTQ